MTHVELAPGYRISRIIKGGWQLAGGHGAIERAQAVADMAAFAEAGITTFDCADIYAGVEERIGDFLRQWRPSHQHATEHVRVHTKFVPDLDALAALTAHEIRRTIDRSRERLGVRTVDLVQFHWWDYAIPGVVEAARYLATLREEGKIRQLGVTNFDTPHLARLLDAGIPIISHQVQYSLLDRRAAGDMAALCAAREVGIFAFGAVAGGFISDRWLGAPEPSEPLENRSLTKYKLVIDEFGGWARFQSLLRTLAEIGDRHGVKLGTVAIRWVLDQPAVAAVIVGARHAGHLDDTRRALALQLTDADRTAIDDVLALATGPLGDVYDLERDREGAHGRIMRYNLNAAR
ncbi:MAG: aldo/keto reductase [Gemmatimonadetes bacterium]|nr:aldo/keto reductase [Gemmatimonadota bacterium]